MGDRRKVAAIATLSESRSLILQREVVKYYSQLAKSIKTQFLNFGIDGVNSAINNAETILTNILIDKNGATVDQVGNKQLNIIESRIKKQFEIDFANQLQFFLASRALRTTLLVSGTDRAQAAGIVANGFTVGLTQTEIAAQLSATFTSVAKAFRASMIARTETSIAAAEAQNRAVDEAEVEIVKEWVAINDDRTRDNHKSPDVDGQIREKEGTFQVGLDTMRGPHDLSASAGNIVNCRCVLNYIPKSIL